MYVVQEQQISLLIGDCIERESDNEREQERESKRERGYVHL